MCTDGNFDDEYFKGTEESNKFRQEYEMRKMKQVNFLPSETIIFPCFHFALPLDVRTFVQPDIFLAMVLCRMKVWILSVKDWKP
jgi:hypothetical protein